MYACNHDANPMMDHNSIAISKKGGYIEEERFYVQSNCIRAAYVMHYNFRHAKILNDGD